MKGRVLKEILSPEFGEDLPKSLIPRLAFKYRRWKGSAWKHELCYKESMWRFFKSVWQFCSYLFWPQWGRHPKDAGTTELGN